MKRFRILPLVQIPVLVVALLPFSHADAAPLLPPVHVRTFGVHSDPEERSSFSLPSGNQAGGLSVAVGDLGTDGTAEIVTGNGLGASPLVHVYRKDGSEVGSFLAYAPDMGSGINVAVCDLTGDGTNEIATAPGRGGGPHLRLFNAMGEAIDSGGTFAYAESFRGGMNLACGDVNGDGKDELVTFPASSGGPHVRVWNLENSALTLQEEFFAFDAAHRAGLVGVVHKGMLSVASARASEDKTMKTFSLSDLSAPVETKTLAYDASGISSLISVDDILYLTTTSGSQLQNISTGHVTTIEAPFGSVTAAAGDVDGDGVQEIVAVPSRPMYHETDAELPRSVVVDISDQRIFAYEYGVLTNTFLISSARSGYTTPRGTHTVLAKPYLVHYAWSYGVGHANNYDLGFVPYNLRFFPHIYIHYAPWHNNFGTPQSRGCVNVNLENIKWIYEWAQVGDQIHVQD